MTELLVGALIGSCITGLCSYTLKHKAEKGLDEELNCGKGTQVSLEFSRCSKYQILENSKSFIRHKRWFNVFDENGKEPIYQIFRLNHYNMLREKRLRTLKSEGMENPLAEYDELEEFQKTSALSMSGHKVWVIFDAVKNRPFALINTIDSTVSLVVPTGVATAHGCNLIEKTSTGSVRRMLRSFSNQTATEGKQIQAEMEEIPVNGENYVSVGLKQPHGGFEDEQLYGRSTDLSKARRVFRSLINTSGKEKQDMDLQKRKLGLRTSTNGLFTEFILGDRETNKPVHYRWMNNSFYLEKIINDGKGHEEVYQRVAFAQLAQCQNSLYKIEIDESQVNRSIVICTIFLQMKQQWKTKNSHKAETTSVIKH